MRARILLFALAALLLPLPALAQDTTRPNPMDRILLRNSSIDFLLSKSTELALTPDLTAKLTALDARFEEKAKPIRAQIQAQLPQDMGGDREAMRAAMQQVRPLTQQLRDLDQQFVGDAVKLLGADQQAAANRLLEERRAMRGPRRS
jgi:hypothetical protein